MRTLKTNVKKETYNCRYDELNCIQLQEYMYIIKIINILPKNILSTTRYFVEI